MLILYSFLTWCLQPLVRRKLMHRAKQEPLYAAHLEERFGDYEHTSSSKLSSDFEGHPLIWLHAVSLGEVRAAAILLSALRRAKPPMRLLLTTSTATGRAEGQKLLLSGDSLVWQPWDTVAATSGFFQTFKPQLGILMETEIWPNWIAAAAAAHVPVALVNARMNERSYQKSNRWFIRPLAKQAYHSLKMVLAQTNLDQLRLTKLGAKIDGVFGNLKFDVTPNADQVRAGRQLQQQLPKPVVLFASSREGEEAIFLTALQRLSASEREAVQWLVVPRHPQRFDEVAALIESAGLKILRRSSGFLSIPSSPDTVWLGDSVGEMAFYYSLSKVALLGGSFEKLGGQNLIEALACDCPVIMGPHTFNFKEAADLATASGVAFRVPSLQAALNKALQPMLVETNQAGDFVAAHRGAADQTACALISLIAR